MEDTILQLVLTEDQMALAKALYKDMHHVGEDEDHFFVEVFVTGLNAYL